MGRNGWCLPRRLAMSVSSQVPILSVWALDVNLCEGYRFQMATWSRKASPGHRTWREKEKSFFLHFWRRSTSTGRISSRHRFTQPRNQSQSFCKKNQTFIPLPSWWSKSDWQTKLQTDRKTIKRAWNLPVARNAPSAGTERIDRIEKCHSGLWNSIVFSNKTTSCNWEFHQDQKESALEFRLHEEAKAENVTVC